ncbi:class I adenylate cyclase, partial [Desulfobacterales bacterium HSG17]|nr:class I adenylate cyclase [Desulfobacterales bacterium HSG17]
MYRQLRANKKRYVEYNRFRKAIFMELAPKEGFYVLYLLPWLLSINHPSCPGYLAGLKRPFRVFHIDNDPEIRKRESQFKRMFGITSRGSLLKPSSEYHIIQGLYTIGSVGTISQTSSSDCDTWVCYDKSEYDEQAWQKLNQKINLIKDWLDMNIKMPVFFFISELSDIQQNNFGSLDGESCGSSQRNVLKEEFYRTSIVISGKLPLWWLCHSPDKSLDYREALSAITNDEYGFYEVVDFGNLEIVEKDEYFGSALWQFHKSLSNPLKSIIKMVLLKMLVDAAQEALICHRFRAAIMEQDEGEILTDPSVFTIHSIFDYYADNDLEVQEFLKECFYLRCDLKPYDKKSTLKREIAAELYREFPLDIKTRLRLSKFQSWDFNEQVELGEQLFRLLLKIYKDIFSTHSKSSEVMSKQDLTILGRIISTCHQAKKHKVNIIKKPTGTLNTSNLTLKMDNELWLVYSGMDNKLLLFSHTDIIQLISYLVWNNLFVESRISMEPNPSSVTLQEIINLGRKIRDFVGGVNVTSIDHDHFLRKERVIKMLVIVSFEKSPYEKDINDFSVVYRNSWGELFVDRFNSPRKLQNFLKKYTIDPMVTDT